MLVVTGACVLVSALVAVRLVRYFRAAEIVIDYPADGAIFPPEITPPTFLWRDANGASAAWSVEVTFEDGSPPIRVQSAGEPMRLGEIDPRCGTPTNTPTLTPEQAATRSWTPEPGTWKAIKERSVKRPAIVTIAGFRTRSSGRPASQGRVKI